MNCLQCGGRTEVVDTERFSMHVWRRRRCLACNHRMNTHENFVNDDKNSRTQKPRAKVTKPPKEVKAVAPVQPLPVRNPRRQIENIKEYLQYRRVSDDDIEE